MYVIYGHADCDLLISPLYLSLPCDLSFILIWNSQYIIVTCSFFLSSWLSSFVLFS